MDVRQDSPGPTYVRPSRRVDTRSTYRGWLLHRGVSRQVPLGLNATLTINSYCYYCSKTRFNKHVLEYSRSRAAHGLFTSRPWIAIDCARVRSDASLH